MIYVAIIGTLLVAIVIMFFFKNVTTFILLLTAISTLLLGIYQLSKDNRQIEFTILFTDTPPPTGLGNIMIVNTGYLPVYFFGGSPSEKEQRILVFSYSKKINIFKKFLNNLNRKWFSPFKNNTITESFVIQDNKTNESHSHSVVINSGNLLSHNFNSWDYKEFFKNGESFFIADEIGNIFYMKQESVDAIKKILEKYEKNQSNSKASRAN